MKIPIGIFFGGATPARDQSYQTAQRVFQRLNRNDFDPIPVLVDPFGQLVLLDDLPSGESISEFYPSEKEQVPQQDVPFTFYPEQLGEVSETQKVALALSVGRVIDIAELPEIISIAFLALPDVEQLQLSLHEMRIPFTGEVAEFIHLCADRYRLLLEMQKCGFEMPACIRLTTKDWQDNNIQAIWGEDSVSVAYPLLLRPAYQYSTGRSSVVDAKDGPDGLRRAIDLAFGQKRLAQDDWLDMSPVDRENFVQHLAQWSSGVGFPLELWQKDEPMIFLDPTSLLAFLNQMPTSEKGQLVFRAQGNNDEILVSSLPEGTAVACVLIRNEDQQWDVADLRLLGNASRIVADLQKTGARPLKVADSMIEQIGTDCGKLAEELNAQTAVKIYGILDNSGRFIPEEVQAFTGPDKADNISASAIKSFIVASLQAGQIRHSDPIYRSLLAQLNSHSDIQPDVVSEAPYGYGPEDPPKVESPVFAQEEEKTVDALTDQEPEVSSVGSERLAEKAIINPAQPESKASEIPVTNRALYERELQKLNREKEVTPESVTALNSSPRSNKDEGNLWTNMKLFFSSSLLWKNVGAIAAFLVLLFLIVNMSLRMYTRHGDSMQLEDYRGLLLEEAQRKAKTKDLKIKVQNSVFVLGKRPGEIATQYPAPLSKVKEDRTVFVTIYKEQGGDVVLPAFTEVGDDLQSYRDAIGNRKVTLLVKDSKFNPKLAEGTILYLLVKGKKITNTELLRDSVKVSEGSTVEAVVSTRTSASVDMPNLVCQLYDAAIFHLQAKELVVGKVYGGSEGNRDSYYVWKQDPSFAPGKLIPKGTQIDIYLIPTKPDECE